jgi:two-component system NtrC family sensor kinase
MDDDTDRIRVLVIDSSRNVRDFVAEQILTPNGYTPILARNGVEGLRVALMELPDLIIMDVELPMMSGRDVLESLRSRPLRIPVILIASRGFEHMTVSLLRMGVRDVVEKPFTGDELLQSIDRVLYELQLRRDKMNLTHRLALAKRQLRQYLVEQSIFGGVGRAVAAQMPLDDLLERVVDAALYITQSEECALLLNDPLTGERTEKFAKRRARGVTQPMLSNAVSDPGSSGAVEAMLHTPIKSGTREIGVLSANNKTAPRSFNEHERQLLRILADYAAIAIETARLPGHPAEPYDVEQDSEPQG